MVFRSISKIKTRKNDHIVATPSFPKISFFHSIKREKREKVWSPAFRDSVSEKLIRLYFWELSICTFCKMALGCIVCNIEAVPRELDWEFL